MKKKKPENANSKKIRIVKIQKITSKNHFGIVDNTPSIFIGENPNKKKSCKCRNYKPTSLSGVIDTSCAHCGGYAP